MKKTLLFILLGIWSALQAQEYYNYNGADVTSRNVPCNIEVPTQGVLASRPFNQNLKQADDFVVAPGEQITINQIKLILMSPISTATTISERVKIAFYQNNDSAEIPIPGTQIGMEQDIVPTSQTIISTDGANIFEVVIDISPVVLSNTTSTDLTYWLGIEIVNPSIGAYDDHAWESLPWRSNLGNYIAFELPDGGWFSDGDGGGFLDEGFAFDLIGDCILLVGVSENPLIQFSFYPNPVIDKLFINSGNLSIDEILLYNIQGQPMKIPAIDISNGNTTLDLTSLANGVYALRVGVNEFTETYRFLKQ